MAQIDDTTDDKAKGKKPEAETPPEQPPAEDNLPPEQEPADDVPHGARFLADVYDAVEEIRQHLARNERLIDNEGVKAVAGKIGPYLEKLCGLISSRFSKLYPDIEGLGAPASDEAKPGETLRDAANPGKNYNPDDNPEWSDWGESGQEWGGDSEESHPVKAAGTYLSDHADLLEEHVKSLRCHAKALMGYKADMPAKEPETTPGDAAAGQENLPPEEEEDEIATKALELTLREVKGLRKSLHIPTRA